MTTIKKTTKKGQRMIVSASHKIGYFLSDVYGSYSAEKGRAWKQCHAWYEDDMINRNGRNFRIISYNTFGFSVAWDTDEGLRIETHNNSYLIA